MPKFDKIGTYQAGFSYHGMEWRSDHAPKHHFYLFNISARTFEKIGQISLTLPGVDETCPSEVGIGNADPATGVPEKVVKGKGNERYRYVTSFPQPILTPKPDDQDGLLKTIETDCRRYLNDLLNSNNLSLDQFQSVPKEQEWAQGCDVGERGVFYSISNPPQKEDLARAYARMEKYYKRLLDNARTLELTDKAGLQAQLSGNPDYGYAAEYFGEEHSWRPKPLRSVECPNCGGKKPAGRLFHMADFGLCVEPTVEAWQAIVKAGVRTYDSVPEELRWRKEEKVAVGADDFSKRSSGSNLVAQKRNETPAE